MQDLLLTVERPARYIGSELNAAETRKKRGLRFGLCFPNLYEIGMSNLGFRIIYGLLNSKRGYSCERFFMPGLDMLSLIRAGKARLLSLEQKKGCVLPTNARKQS